MDEVNDGREKKICLLVLERAIFERALNDIVEVWKTSTRAYEDDVNDMFYIAFDALRGVKELNEAHNAIPG